MADDIRYTIKKQDVMEKEVAQGLERVFRTIRDMPEGQAQAQAAYSMARTYIAAARRLVGKGRTAQDVPDASRIDIVLHVATLDLLKAEQALTTEGK